MDCIYKYVNGLSDYIFDCGSDNASTMLKLLNL